MVTKSIIDRILILAAVVCAAGLAWQLTVLLTSKAQMSAVHKAEAVVQPSPTPVASALPDASNAPSVRVVYPPEQGLQAPKTTAKASDGPLTSKSAAPASAAAPSSPAPAAVAPAVLQPQAAPFAVPSAVATAPVLPASPAPAAPTSPAAATAASTTTSASATPTAGAPPVAEEPAPAASDSPSASPPANDAVATVSAPPAALPPTEVQPQPAGWSPEPAAASADQPQATATTSATAGQTEAANPAPRAGPQKVASLGGAPTHQAAVAGLQSKRPSAGGININNASVDALDHLHGGGHIGQAIARHRPYRSIEDLVKKRVLRRDTYEQIKNQIATQ